MEEKKANSKRKPLHKTPAPLLYDGARVYMGIMCRKKFNLTCEGEKIKGPALLLSNHTSNQDYKFIAAAIKPARVTFLASFHWFTFKKLGFWLRRIGAIPKFQFTTDLESMKKMKYIVQEKKGVVWLAPEGTVYASGHLGYISPSIAKMIKFFKVPVYACKIQGAGLGNAKWSKNTHKGQVLLQTNLIIDDKEVQELSKDEIMERVVTSLQYNEFTFQKEHNVIVPGEDKAEGFDTMYYKCPCCGKEFTIKSYGNTVECTSCGAKATFKDDFTFKWEGEKQYFQNYSQWYDWQYECVKEEVSKPDFQMEDTVEYGINKPGIDNYIKVGKGKLTFNHEGWTYDGTFEGKDVHEHDEPRQVYMAVLKVGVHIELPYRFDHCRVFYPQNGMTAIKWSLASIAMSELLEEKQQ